MKSLKVRLGEIMEGLLGIGSIALASMRVSLVKEIDSEL